MIGFRMILGVHLGQESVGAKPVSGKRDPLYGINKRTLTVVEGKTDQNAPGQPRTEQTGPDQTRPEKLHQTN